ncbi:MAG: DJ-1 family glyoxalase III [bacterium]
MTIMVPLAAGFEEIEAVSNIDVLRRAGLKVITVSLNDELMVNGAHNIMFQADGKITDIGIDELDGIVLPGGMPGAVNLRDNGNVINIVKKLNDKNKLVAAICAAPIVLEKAGVIQSKNVTSYPGFEDELRAANYIPDMVVQDGNIITGRGPGAALEFALTIVKYLLDDEISDKLKKDMIVKD